MYAALETGFLKNVGTATLVVVIAILTALFVVSAVPGVEKGIQWLSNTNMGLALVLAIFVALSAPRSSSWT